MNWNYRIVSRETQYGTEYGIREFYYDGEGNIYGWTENNETVYGDDVEDIRSSLTWMLEACDKPVIPQSKLDEIIARYRSEDPPKKGNALEHDISNWEGEGGSWQ